MCEPLRFAYSGGQLFIRSPTCIREIFVKAESLPFVSFERGAVNGAMIDVITESEWG